MSSSSAKGLFNWVLKLAGRLAKSFGTVQKAAEQQPIEHVVTITRLTPEVYEAFEKNLPQPSTPKDGTEAAYLLGQQSVLKQLRAKLVTR